MKFDDLIKNDYKITFDERDFDYNFVHRSLQTAYWTKDKNLSVEDVTKAFKNAWSAMIFRHGVFYNYNNDVVMFHVKHFIFLALCRCKPVKMNLSE